MGTTVHLIFTAQSLGDRLTLTLHPQGPLPTPKPPSPFPNLYLGHGAAPPRAVWHRAARGRLGTLDLAVRALDGGA